MHHDGIDRWDRHDLIRRVLQALDLTERTVHAAVRNSRGESVATRQVSDREPAGDRSEIAPLALSKVLGEAALLLRCAAPISDLDERIGAAIEQVAQLIIPHARDSELLAALCVDPGLALDHAFTHIQLGSIGYPDLHVDRLLAESLDAGNGPERPPTLELEQRWLHRLWAGIDSATSEECDLLRRSSLGRPLDALGSTFQDIYAFTHVVLYTSDLGRRGVSLPRSHDEITADAEAALATSLDADNFDLAAELLWTWPMLGLTWSPAAVFGFAVVAAAQDEHGFLPGPGYHCADHHALPADQRDDYVLETSYHTTLVMGLLCSAALRAGRTPPAAGGAGAAAAGGVPGAAADSVYTLLGRQHRRARWQQAFRRLDEDRREALAGFVLAVALRRARASSDLKLVREILRMALLHGLVDAPAPRQAVGLLRRSTLLGAGPDLRITGRLASGLRGSTS